MYKINKYRFDQLLSFQFNLQINQTHLTIFIKYNNCLLDFYNQIFTNSGQAIQAFRANSHLYILHQLPHLMQTSQFGIPSEIQSKRQAFHKQIRNKFKNEYFSIQRKLLYAKQLSIKNLSLRSNQTLNSQIKFTSEWLEQKLNILFAVEYESINQYILNDQSEKISEESQHRIFEIISKPESLKNQHALIMFSNLLKRQQFIKEILSPERIQYFVENLIERNIVIMNEESNQSYQQQQKENFKSKNKYGIDFFNSVCWLLFSLAVKIKDNQQFMCLKKCLPFLEEQSITQSQSEGLNIGWISLISQLSSCSQLLPSKQYISYLLTQSLPYSQNKQLVIVMVNLIDNFMRFQQQEDQKLIYLYIKFINTRLKELSLPSYLKTQLIDLYSTLLNSQSQTFIVSKIFSYPQSFQILQEVYYRAAFGNYEGKVSSLICLFQIIKLEGMHQKIVKIIPSQYIVAMIANSLVLPDQTLRNQIIVVVMHLMNENRAVYKGLFQKQRLMTKVLVMIQQEQNSSENAWILMFCSLLEQLEISQ